MPTLVAENLSLPAASAPSPPGAILRWRPRKPVVLASTADAPLFRHWKSGLVDRVGQANAFNSKFWAELMQADHFNYLAESYDLPFPISEHGVNDKFNS
jgi:hypothetical protein